MEKMSGERGQNYGQWRRLKEWGEKGEVWRRYLHSNVYADIPLTSDQLQSQLIEFCWL